MSFLRRLLGGGGEGLADRAQEDAPDAPDDEAADREVLRAEDERLDEFRRRQLRYAKWSWRPPAQGGTRRADDAEATAGSHAEEG